MCFKLPGFTRIKIIWHNVIILEHYAKSITYTLKPIWAIPHSNRIMWFPWSVRLFHLMYFQVLVKFSSQNSFGGYCYSLSLLFPSVLFTCYHRRVISPLSVDARLVNGKYIQNTFESTASLETHYLVCRL